MTDQNIRSELKMLYISMETFSGIKMAFNDYANTLDATDSKRQAISSAFDSDDEDILPTSGVGLMLTLKLFLLYVANGNGRVTAQQLSYIDKMVDDDILDASVSAASLMVQVPSFNEGPLYPIKFLDVLIRNDSMSKYLHPENNQSGAIRCVCVFSELGRGVIALDENTVSTQRYREFIQNLRDLAIESGDGAYSKADFAFVAANINSSAKRNSTQMTAPAKKATARKATTAPKTAAQRKVEKPTPSPEPVSADGFVIVGTGQEKILQRAYKDRLDLEKVEIAEGVKQIQTYAFKGCSNLKEIRLSSSIKTIGRGAFHGSGILEIVIPDGMEELSMGAFCGMHELQRVFIPDTIKWIRDWLDLHKLEHFEHVSMSCSTAVRIAHSSSEMRAFCDKIQLPNVDAAEGSRIIRGVDDDGTLHLLDATEVQDNGYKNRDDLDRIVVPNGVTRIGECAFERCKNLREVVLPGSITEVGESAFAYCENLQRVIFPANMNGETRIGKRAFSWCPHLGEITLPFGLIEIGEGAMLGCNILKHMELPSSLRILGAECFGNCFALTDIVIPASVEYVGKGIVSGAGLVESNITFLGTPKQIDGDPYDAYNSPVDSFRITQAFYDRYKNTDWLRKYMGYHSLEENCIYPKKVVIINPKPAAPVSAPRAVGNSGSAPATPKKADPNADRRQQLEAQIRSLEAERDAVRGLFGGTKRKKLQNQIDELRAELKRLS